MCVSRFDSDTKSTFLDLYTKVDAEAITVTEEAPPPTDEDEPVITEEVDFSEPVTEEEAF